MFLILVWRALKVSRKIHNPDWITKLDTLQSCLADSMMHSRLWQWIPSVFSHRVSGSVGAEEVDTSIEPLAPDVDARWDRLHSSPTAICSFGGKSWNSERSLRFLDNGSWWLRGYLKVILLCDNTTERTMGQILLRMWWYVHQWDPQNEHTGSLGVQLDRDLWYQHDYSKDILDWKTSWWVA